MRASIVLGMTVVVAGMLGAALPAVQAGESGVARGAALFAENGCAHCHGKAGVGGGNGPDLQLVRRRMTAAQMTQQIHDGSKAMPAFGDVLRAEQIADLVVYLRAKRVVVPVPAKAVVVKPMEKDPE